MEERLDLHIILDKFRRPDPEYAKLQLVEALWARCFINICFNYRISWTPSHFWNNLYLNFQKINRGRIDWVNNNTFSNSNIVPLWRNK